MKKDELLRQLKENEAYKNILSAASSEKERRMIKVHTENFMAQFFKDVLEPIQKIVENDPEALNKYLSEFQSTLINSGSTGK